MRRPALLLPLLPVLLCAACSSTRTIGFQEERPAELAIDGIRNVAVADLDGSERSGRIVAAKVAQGIVERGAYRLFEREKVEAILAEHDFNKSGVVDPETIRQLRLAGVDALIFGAVDAFGVEDQRGSTPEERRVGTGEFRTIEWWDDDDEETRTREEEIMKTVIVQRPFLVRQGSLGVTFRLTNVSTGEVVAVEAMSASFQEKTMLDGTGAAAPSREAIFDRLASDVVERFLRKIQPHRISGSLEFEPTRHAQSKLGANFAAAGLWDRAVEAFAAAAAAEPGKHAAHWNHGAALFAAGRYAEAAAALERAIALSPRQKYVNLLATAENRRRG